MGKKNPNDSQKTFQLAEEERQARNKQLGEVSTTGTELKGIAGTNAAELKGIAGAGATELKGLAAKSGTATRGIADTTASAVNPALERFYDPSGSGMSDWKRGQINTRTTDTTKAFNNAQAAQRARAKVAGFGYLQPTEQAGETGIDIGRAGALSRIRGDVENESIPIEMEALRAREASGVNQAGVFQGANALEQQGVSTADTLEQQGYGSASELEQAGYGDVGRLQLGEAGEFSPEQYYQTGATQAENEAKRRAALWGSIAKLGATAVGGAFGGLPGATLGSKIL